MSAQKPSILLHICFQKPHDDLHRLLSTTLSYVNMVNHCSLLLPLSTASSLWKQPGKVGFWPHLNYKVNNTDSCYQTVSIVRPLFLGNWKNRENLTFGNRIVSIVTEGVFEMLSGLFSNFSQKLIAIKRNNNFLLSISER